MSILQLEKLICRGAEKPYVEVVVKKILSYNFGKCAENLLALSLNNYIFQLMNCLFSVRKL